MSNHAERYERVATGFGERLAGVKSDQWSDATPCRDWDVQQLVAHVINTQRAVLGALGETGPEIDSDGDLAAQWHDYSGQLLSAVQDPETAATEVTTFGGNRLPFEELVGGLACSDTVIHTWDLARATGQEEDLDPEAVGHCAGVLAGYGDSMRRPGGFDPELPSPPGADAQTKFLHFAGRAV